jgi:hypothetical protein
LIELYGEPTNYKIALRDKAGLSKGTLLMDLSGNKSLQNIGFADDDVLYIIANNAEVEGSNDDSKDAKKSSSRKRKPKNRGTQSSNNVSSRSNTNT